MFAKKKETLPPRRQIDGGELGLAELKRLSDEELMEHIKQGSHDAFAHLFDRYYRLVLSIALKILRNNSEAEDLMQEVFFEIYRKVDNFDAGRGPAKYWIMRYAYSRSLDRLDYLNTRQCYQAPKLTEVYAMPVEQGREDWLGLTADEWGERIHRGLATLNPKQRMAIELACFKGHSLKEIADLMNETLGNTRHHYYRGIKKLREYLHDSSQFEERLARSRKELIKGVVDVES